MSNEKGEQICLDYKTTFYLKSCFVEKLQDK